MSKRKILTLALTLCMVAILAVGGTLAYFTDSDFNKNVMTTGNVKIDQIEQQRDDQGKLVDFTDNKKLYPITETFKYDKYVEIVPGQKTRPLADNDYNVVDKIVTVQNTGSEAAYARTLFAYEMLAVKDDEGNVIEWKYPLEKMNGPLVVSTVFDIYGNGMQAVVDADGKWKTFELGENKYVVCEYYHGALAPQEISVPSLLQIYLKSDVNNEFYDYVGAEYDILVLSQATQTKGFTDCRQALEQAFGKVADADLADWFSKTASKDLSKDA